MNEFADVDVRKLSAGNFQCELIESNVQLAVKPGQDVVLTFTKNDAVILKIATNAKKCSRTMEKCAFINVSDPNILYIVAFKDSVQIAKFMSVISGTMASEPHKFGRGSAFDARTDSWSAVQYFQFYSYLSQQQNMMQDYIRTSTYQRAILANSKTDFMGKVVLDVGAGSGILSFFAVQAGAKRVYAVEASNMAEHCQTLVQANKLAGRIVVVSGKIEDITLPEPVDVIISEPMGYMLYNERMLETYVHARKFLAPQHRAKKKGAELGENGKFDCDMIDVSGDKKPPATEGEEVFAESKPGVMFPSVGKMYVAPFSDEALFAELFTKANFWYQQSFHGMDLSALRGAAIQEYFNQPVVDTFDISICPVNEPCVHNVDFRTVTEAGLANIDIPLVFIINQCSSIHGLAFWFDVGFLGSQTDVWLSTAPTEPLTHWYQVRCLLGTAIIVQEGQVLTGHVKMVANTRQSYDVEIELYVPDTDTKIKNTLDLKNPHFRYTGYPPAPPPGSQTKSPTETYFNNLAASANAATAANASCQTTTSQPAVGTYLNAGGTGAGALVFSAGTADQSGLATVIPQPGVAPGIVNSADVFSNGGWTIEGQTHVLPQGGQFQVVTNAVAPNTMLFEPQTSVS